jgi:hypothetical protein
MSSDTNYDKIKHLVEIEDDIFAVFTINSKGEAIDLNVAKNVDVEKSIIENIFTNFNKILDDKIGILPHSSNEILGKLKWKVTEYEKIRILQIIEKDKIKINEDNLNKIYELSHEEYLDELISNYLRCISINQGNNLKKAKCLNIAQWIFLAGLTTIPIIMGILLLNLPNSYTS